MISDGQTVSWACQRIRPSCTPWGAWEEYCLPLSTYCLWTADLERDCYSMMIQSSFRSMRRWYSSIDESFSYMDVFWDFQSTDENEVLEMVQSDLGIENLHRFGWNVYHSWYLQIRTSSTGDIEIFQERGDLISETYFFFRVFTMSSNVTSFGSSSLWNWCNGYAKEYPASWVASVFFPITVVFRIQHMQATLVIIKHNDFCFTFFQVL